MSIINQFMTNTSCLSASTRLMNAAQQRNNTPITNTEILLRFALSPMTALLGIGRLTLIALINLNAAPIVGPGQQWMTNVANNIGLQNPNNFEEP